MGKKWGGSVVPYPVDDPEHHARWVRPSPTRCADAVGRRTRTTPLGLGCSTTVLLPQTVIGLEAKEQMALAGRAAAGRGDRARGVEIQPGRAGVPLVAGRGVRLVAAEDAVRRRSPRGGSSTTSELRRADPDAAHVQSPRTRAAVHPTQGRRYHGDSPIISALVATAGWRRGLTQERCSRRRCSSPAPRASRRPRGRARNPRGARTRHWPARRPYEPVILFKLTRHGPRPVRHTEDYLAAPPEETGQLARVRGHRALPGRSGAAVKGPRRRARRP